jgi:hypothetical protein
MGLTFYLFIYFFFMALQPFGPSSLFQFLNPIHSRQDSLNGGDQPVARPLPTHRTTQTQNKSTQASMPRVGFEPTTPVFKRAKTVRALDRAKTVIGGVRNMSIKYVIGQFLVHLPMFSAIAI